MAKNKVRNTSVRDHAQEASLRGDRVRITMFVGNREAGHYELDADALRNAWKECPGNPRYARREYLASIAREHLVGDGGEAQADRIIDAQLAACEKLLGIPV